MKRANQVDTIATFKAAYPTFEMMEIHGLKILTGYKDDNPVAFVWRNKVARPYIRSRYLNVEALEASMLKEIKAAKECEEAKKARKIPVVFEEGDIFVSSWGYEQTNIDAFQVIKKKSNHTAIIQEISFKQIAVHSSMSGSAIPVPNDFIGEPMTKRVTSWGIKIHSSATARKWDKQREFYHSSYA